MPNTPATERQIGGDHYVSLAIQPFEFAMRNQWDAGAFSILKYLVRFRRKGGLVDLDKARHFIELRLVYGGPRLIPGVIPMQKFIEVNRVDPDTGLALRALERWAYSGRAIDADTLCARIDHLVDTWRPPASPVTPTP